MIFTLEDLEKTIMNAARQLKTGGILLVVAGALRLCSGKWSPGIRRCGHRANQGAATVKRTGGHPFPGTGRNTALELV